MSNVATPETLSPLWVAQKIDRCLETLTEFVARAFSRDFVVVLFFISTSLVLSYVARFWAPGFSSVRLLTTCVLFGIAALLIKTNWIYTAWFRFLIFFGLCFLLAFKGSPRPMWCLTAIVQVVSFVVFVGLSLVATIRWPWRARIFAYICILLLSYTWRLAIGVWVPAFIFQNWIYSNDFFALLMICPLLMNQIIKNQRSLGWREASLLISHALNPTILVEPVLFKISELPENQIKDSAQQRAERTTAYLSFCGGALALVLSTLIYRELLTSLPENVLFQNLKTGWFTYLFYVFFWLGLLRLGFATARLFGYNLAKPSYYSLLAANPLERWRVWNTYLYNWFLMFVFLPISRTTNSVVIGAATVFGINFFFHVQIQLSALWVYPNHVSRGLLFYLRGEILFFTLHALMVLVGFATLRYWPPMRLRSGWIGVAITHLMMAITHSVVHLRL